MENIKSKTTQSKDIQTKIGVVLLLILFGVVLINALSLIVITPLTGSVFNDKNISYNLSSDTVSDFYILENRLKSNSADKLCDDVTSCNKTKKAREGNNNISIRIINTNGDIDSKNIDFLVDTIAPDVIKTEPRNSSFMNNDDNFSVEYSEVNLKNITLNYGNTTKINKIVKSTCESGKKKLCTFSVNLSEFDGQEIKYWFDLVDIINNKGNSSVKLIKVDTDKPKVKSNSSIIDGNRVNFMFEIEEENFDKIILRDTSTINPKWVRFCSRLVVGVCTPSKTFQPGVHAIDVKVLDKAGNEESIYSNLIIII